MTRVTLLIAAALCFGLGLLLLGLNLVGSWLPPAEFDGDGATAPIFRDRTRTTAEANADFAALLRAETPGLEEARRLNHIVADRIAHEDYGLQAWDNWYLWLLGFVDPVHRYTLDADLLWRRGQGQCHQAALVYAEKARTLGFDTRLVWMQGHVIARVETRAGVWRAADPDLGIFWPGTVSEIATGLGEDGIARAILSRGHDEATARRMARAYASTDDNVISFVPHLPAHALAERRARIPKWCVPMLLLVVGAGLGWRARRSTPQAETSS